MTWPVVALGELAQWGSGGTPPRSRQECFGPGTPWLSIADLNDGLVRSAKEHLTDEGLRSCAAKVVQPGTVLIAMYGSIGKLGVAGVELCTSQAIAFASPNEGRLLARYLYHFLLWSRPGLTALGRGGTQMNIGQQDLKRMQIPLPPIEEQRRIAAILDHADSLGALSRAALHTATGVRASLLRALIDDPSAEKWPVVRVEDVAVQSKSSIRTGPFGSQLLHSEFVDHGVAVLGIDNAVANEFRWGAARFITPEKYQSLQRYTVRAGDVIVTIMGTCGRCAVVPDDIPLAINTKHLCCITLDQDKCLPEFLHASILGQHVSREALDRWTKGAIMDGLNMGYIKNMPMVLPPIALQREFVEELRAVSAERYALQQRAAHLDTLFASLQSRAFSGRL